MVLYGVYRKPYAFKGINTILLVAALGFMGSVLLQGKMWLYHFIPVLSLSLIFLHGLTLQASIVPRVAFYCAVIMVALRLLISPGLYLLKPDNIYRQAVADLNHLTPKPRNVYFFSTGLLMTANVSLAADLQWVSRFSSLFYLPALYGEYPAGLLPHRRQEIEQFFVQGVIEDFQKNPPDVVLVDTSKNIEFMGNADFSFLKHYLQYPAFAQIWQQYTYVRNIENFSVYQRRLSNDH